MLNFFSISDYRDLLKNFYVSRKSEFKDYSYRLMAMNLGLDSSHLYRILKKKQHLPAKSIPLAKTLLGLGSEDSQMFDLMFAMACEKDLEEREKLYQKAFRLREPPRKILQESELDLFECWSTPIVRSLLEVTRGIGDSHKIARLLEPPITEKQAEKTIQRLLEQRQIVKIASGKYKLVDEHVSVGNAGKGKSRVRQYQSLALDYAKIALEKIPVEDRNISTLTINVDDECFEDLQEMFVSFRKQLLKRVHLVKSPNRVMQVALAIYPVTKKEF